jgi:hypothetical protein
MSPDTDHDVLIGFVSMRLDEVLSQRSQITKYVHEFLAVKFANATPRIMSFMQMGPACRWMGPRTTASLNPL